MSGLVEVADGAAVGDLLILGQVQEVHDGPAAAVPARLGQIVDFAPIDLTAVGEEEQIGMGTGHEEVLDGIFFLGSCAFEAFPAAALCAVGGNGGALDISVAAVSKKDEVVLCPIWT